MVAYNWAVMKTTIQCPEFEKRVGTLEKGGSTYGPMSVEDARILVALEVRLTSSGGDQSKLSPQEQEVLVGLRKKYFIPGEDEADDEQPRFRH